MKKTLVAIAALAATGAFAQSSVTLYGIVDAGVFNTKAGGVTQTVVTSGATSSSRLGFKGTEDLGGGMKANFGLESGLSVDNGGMGGPSGNTSATTGTNQFFSRGAFAGLSGGFGTINAGKISTHSNTHILANTPGATNIAAVSFRTYATSSSGWLDNTVEYVSPTMSGLTARVLHTAGNTKSTSTGAEGITAATKKYGSGQEFGLTYANGPMTVAAYTATRKLQDSATAEAKTTGFGGTYDFGVAKVGFSSNASEPDNTTANDKLKGTSFAVQAPLNAKVTLAGFYGMSKKLAATEQKAKFIGLDVGYALSKRTTAYANYTQVSNSGGGTATLAGMGVANAAPIGAAAADGKASAMGVGLRHSF